MTDQTVQNIKQSSPSPSSSDNNTPILPPTKQELIRTLQFDEMAATLHNSMKGGLTGLGTDREALYATLEKIKSPQDAQDLRNAYAKHYGGASLDKDLDGDLDGKEFQMAKALLDCDSTTYSVLALEHELNAGISEYYNTDEKRIERILQGKTKDEIQKMDALYREKFGMGLEDAIKKEFSGAQQDYFLALLKGERTNEQTLIEVRKLGILAAIQDSDIESLRSAVRDLTPDELKAIDLQLTEKNSSLATEVKKEFSGGTKLEALGLTSGDKALTLVGQIKSQIHWYGNSHNTIQNTLEEASHLGLSKQEFEDYYKNKTAVSIQKDLGLDGDEIFYSTQKEKEKALIRSIDKADPSKQISEAERLYFALAATNVNEAEVLDILAHTKSIEKLKSDYAALVEHFPTLADNATSSEKLKAENYKQEQALDYTAHGNPPARYKDVPGDGDIEKAVKTYLGGRNENIALLYLKHGTPKNLREIAEIAQAKSDLERNGIGNVLGKTITGLGGLVYGNTSKGKQLDNSINELTKLANQDKLSEQDKIEAYRLSKFAEQDFQTYTQARDSASETTAQVALVSAATVATVVTEGAAAPTIAGALAYGGTKMATAGSSYDYNLGINPTTDLAFGAIMGRFAAPVKAATQGATVVAESALTATAKRLASEVGKNILLGGEIGSAGTAYQTATHADSWNNGVMPGLYNIGARAGEGALFGAGTGLALPPLFKLTSTLKALKAPGKSAPVSAQDSLPAPAQGASESSGIKGSASTDTATPQSGVPVTAQDSLLSEPQTPPSTTGHNAKSQGTQPDSNKPNTTPEQKKDLALSTEPDPLIDPQQTTVAPAGSTNAIQETIIARESQGGTYYESLSATALAQAEDIAEAAKYHSQRTPASSRRSIFSGRTSEYTEYQISDLAKRAKPLSPAETREYNSLQKKLQAVNKKTKADPEFSLEQSDQSFRNATFQDNIELEQALFRVQELKGRDYASRVLEQERHKTPKPEGLLTADQYAALSKEYPPLSSSDLYKQQLVNRKALAEIEKEALFDPQLKDGETYKKLIEQKNRLEKEVKIDQFLREESRYGRRQATEGEQTAIIQTEHLKKSAETGLNIVKNAPDKIETRMKEGKLDEALSLYDQACSTSRELWKRFYDGDKYVVEIGKELNAAGAKLEKLRTRYPELKTPEPQPEPATSNPPEPTTTNREAPSPIESQMPNPQEPLQPEEGTKTPNDTAGAPQPAIEASATDTVKEQISEIRQLLKDGNVEDAKSAYDRACETSRELWTRARAGETAIDANLLSRANDELTKAKFSIAFKRLDSLRDNLREAIEAGDYDNYTNVCNAANSQSQETIAWLKGDRIIARRYQEKLDQYVSEINDAAEQKWPEYYNSTNTNSGQATSNQAAPAADDGLIAQQAADDTLPQPQNAKPAKRLDSNVTSRSPQAEEAMEAMEATEYDPAQQQQAKKHRRAERLTKKNNSGNRDDDDRNPRGKKPRQGRKHGGFDDGE